MAERNDEGKYFPPTPNKGVGGGGKNPSLPFRSLEALAEETPTEPPWLWHGFLVPSGITLLSSLPKVGKSSLVAALLPRLAGGEPFLGLATRPTKAVLLTEESEITLLEKARLFGTPAVDVLCQGWVAGRPWQEVSHLAAQYALEQRAGLLVIDTFNAFSGLEGEEENQAGAILHAVAPLRAATTRGLAVLLTAHERKSGGSHGSAVRGSGALVGAVDVVISLGRSSLGPNVRTLETISRFIGTPAELLIELHEGDSYRVLGDGASARTQLDGEKILAALDRLGSADVETLAAETEIPSSTLRRRLRELEEVESFGDGRKGSPEQFRLRLTLDLGEAA